MLVGVDVIVLLAEVSHRRHRPVVHVILGTVWSPIKVVWAEEGHSRNGSQAGLHLTINGLCLRFVQSGQVGTGTGHNMRHDQPVEERPLVRHGASRL